MRALRVRVYNRCLGAEWGSIAYYYTTIARFTGYSIIELFQRTHTHHNRFTALLDFVQVYPPYPGEPAPER